MVRQVKQRARHLPVGMRQSIWIDIRGQGVSDETRDYVTSKILEKSPTGVKVEVVFWKESLWL